MSTLVSLPVDPIADDAASQPAKPKILAVEDNNDMRHFLKRVLERHGYDFLEAGDGIEGFEVALAQHPDLILMDLSLPHVDGYEVTRKLKADPTFASTPILAVTAHARSADEKRAMEVGCDAYLSKPYSIRNLLDLIEAHLPPRDPA